MSRFQKLTIRDAAYTKDANSGCHVFHVRDPHALTQAAGYLKYVHAGEDREEIYFRGQTALHSGLVPSLFRGAKSQGAKSKRMHILNKYIGDVVRNCPRMAQFHECFREPLLQHYGIKTTWMDLVDNIWVALWFACHTARFTGHLREYLNFERRESRRETGSEKYAYILLIGAEAAPVDQYAPGFFRGRASEVVDLRMGVPSIFLRPHAQHGVLFRQRGDKDTRPLDYSSSVRGVIRADIDDALEWLGTSHLLNPHALFPPPTYDPGYGYLLSTEVPGSPEIGAIHHIGT